MAISRYILKTLDVSDRPAIATSIPNQKGGATTMLDLGANVDCSAEHLLQFAIMGSALASTVDRHQRPTIGLLNIGEEVIKRSEERRVGKECSVRVDLGGRRIIKKKNKEKDARHATE